MSEKVAVVFDEVGLLGVDTSVLGNGGGGIDDEAFEPTSLGGSAGMEDEEASRLTDGL